MAFSISFEDSPKPEDVSRVVEGLTGYNRLHAPDDQYQALVLFLRDSTDGLVGGLLGETYWGWLHVRVLWLEEGVRRRGYGTQLLEKAEEEAVRRGCSYAYLDTLSFQAREFYEGKGYTAFGRLDDHPVGHSRHFLTKQLRNRAS
jgi:GNAT superfamily N-acetyltransferase